MSLAIYLVILFQITYSQDFTPIVDIKTLSELPLNKLLQVQNSFKINNQFGIIDNQTLQARSGNVNVPIALALKAKKDVFKRGGHEHEHEHEEEKSKIQSIFQLSVTALAFLSFGGYLLCLIVNAIRAKQMAENNATATQQQILAAIINAQANRQPIRITRLRRRKPRRPTNIRKTKLRRPSNVRKTQQIRRPEQTRRPTRHKRDLELTTWPDNINSNNMYYALVMLSEAYKNYHTTDYQHYNETITRNGI